MAFKCPKCYADNPDTSRFCGECGTQIISVKAAQAALTKTRESPTIAVTPGTIFASRYEILDSVGAGGMGEVYRALDKNLARQVAIKILPAAFAEDKERMARFDREAKLLAVLNHPNIAAIHGLEESDGRRFLILELAEGETLQVRLNRGALPLDDTLEICRQLAEGLEAAHDKGIVHRDLKPGNIMISPDGKVKILDFGLAKAYARETTGVDIEKSPTITAQMTEPGVILGTAAYMSPEQARGRAVDKRADIWASGCVLYECLTGTPAFHGETVSDTLAHILKGEPDWSKLPQDTPIRIKTLLRHCLEKNPKERLHDIADARLELRESVAQLAEGIASSRNPPVRLLRTLVIIGTLFGTLLGAALVWVFRAFPPSETVKSIIKIQEPQWLAGFGRSAEFWRPSRTAFVVSSNGRFIIYSAYDGNPSREAMNHLYIRRTDQMEATPVPGTDRAINPFLSPDDRYVGFFADGKLKRIPVEGGVPIDLCEVKTPFGADWGSDNKIVYADGSESGLFKVSAIGGTPEALTKPDSKREETGHRLPHYLPGGKGILFTVVRGAWDNRPSIAVLDRRTREWRVLLEDAADARYVTTRQLVFLRRGTLMAVSFDLSRLEVQGQPIPVIGSVMQAILSTHSEYNSGAGQFSISESGWLVYVTGGPVPDMENSLDWVDQSGGTQTAVDFKAPFISPRLSPDGKRIAYCRLGNQWGVYVYDLGRGTESRLTSEGIGNFPIWTADGQRLFFSWADSGTQSLYWQLADGSSPIEMLSPASRNSQFPSSVTPDGTTLAMVTEDQARGTRQDIIFFRLADKSSKEVLNSNFMETHPEFSPNGKWLAYSSNESGQEEVYVRRVSDLGGKWKISSNQGHEPLWARNGKRIFYRNRDQVWAVDVRADNVFSPGKPELLFEKSGYRSSFPVRCWDISQDNQRFLMVKLDDREPTPVTEMILVQNWFEELKRLVPTGKK